MKVFVLPTLATSHASEEDFDNMISNAPALPTGISNKKDLEKWRENENTQHSFFSTYEGVQPKLRIQNKEGANVPWRLHGIVMDYDQQMGTDQEVLDSIKKNAPADYYPAAFGRTFSGGAHVVWEFEKPVNLVNTKMLEAFIKTFVARAKCKKILGGLDEKSFDSSQYYTLYDNWTKVGGIIPASLTEDILFQVGKSVRVYEDEGPTLPWDVIEEQIHQQFPGRWKGKVEEGARGVRFWDATATHHNGAMLTSTGVVFFTDGGGFLPWGSNALFGPSFVEKYKADTVTAAIQDVYYDGNRFFRLMEDRWMDDNMQVMRMQLAVRSGLSPVQTKKKPFSEVDEAIVHVTNNNRVDGSFPFVYNKDRIVRRNDGCFINLSNVACHHMADTPKQWGEGFPFIAEWLDGFFINDFQKQLFIAWLHWFYKNAYEGNPKKGQTMFIVGSAGVGKTLLSHRLLDWMMGGHSDIASYLMGKDDFNENLFKTGLATVDDQEAASDYRGHMKFSALVKKLTANQDLSMRKHYAGAVDLTWLGRVLITLNQDPESMQLLPNLDINNKDKLIILRTAPKGITFPVNVEDIIRSELENFCRYVYDYNIPESLKGESRYFVKSFIDPSLLEEVEYSSPDYVVLELIDTWRESYFIANPGETHWFGKVTDLVREFEKEFQGERRTLQDVSPQWLSRKLRTIVSKYDWVEPHTEKGVKGFRFMNPLLG
jgi:hypothetical protein